MKADLHPTYYPEAKVICSCGNTWTTGSTMPEVRTDICSNCHPFYTGEQRIVDTAGQVERFRKRLEHYVKHQETTAERDAERREKSWKNYLNQQIAALDLSDAVFEALSGANVVTLNDLLDKVENDRESLLTLEEFTPKVLKDVKNKLTRARTEILG
jgi:large subunit ribosomal protein L31